MPWQDEAGEGKKLDHDTDEDFQKEEGIFQSTVFGQDIGGILQGNPNESTQSQDDATDPHPSLLDNKTSNRQCHSHHQKNDAIGFDSHAREHFQSLYL
jgi:hypothetical protein